MRDSHPRCAYDRLMRATAMRLLAQSQDAALTAVQVFNNPLIKFKSETDLPRVFRTPDYLVLQAACRVL